MAVLKAFNIDIFRLSQKVHEYSFIIDEKFFQAYDYGIITNGKGTCDLTLEKSSTMMNLHFVVDIQVELVCDRSLDTYEYPIHLEESLIIKYGDENYALSEDVMVIKADTPSIDVSEFLYEYINLAIPMKKLHPRYSDEESGEDEKMIYSSEPDETEGDETVDPRWEALKKLKDNK